jgi:hypothetical protein
MNNVPPGTKVKLRVIDAASESNVLATRDNLVIDTCAKPVSVDEESEMRAPFTITSVHPNPASTSVTCVVGSDKDVESSFVLIATDGSEIVLRSTERLVSGTQTITLPLSNVAVGAYRLAIRSGAMQTSTPLMIVR